MTRAVLSIGSNVGDRRAHLQSVIDSLGSQVLAISPVYETAPWGPVPQGDYLNAVVIADGPGPRDWLGLAHRLEVSALRTREMRWGPRTLDVDVISCREGAHEIVSGDPDLTLPHPRAHLRAFVLIPWSAADPGATLVVDGVDRRVADLVDALPADERAGVRRVDEVLTGPVP